MLGYVFWHRPAAESLEYEGALAQFHQRLREHPTAGFLESASFALREAPWLAGSGPAYEDWYLVEGSAALDPLNDGAIAGARAAAHDGVARLAMSGSGGLYRLRQGAAMMTLATHAHWFQKPPGMSYAALYEILEPRVKGGDAALWGRQMVLGPAPEFCLQTPEAYDLPSPVAALRISLRRVFPAPVQV
jgi:hypothetical protein